MSRHRKKWLVDAFKIQDAHKRDHVWFDMPHMRQEPLYWLYDEIKINRIRNYGHERKQRVELDLRMRRGNPTNPGHIRMRGRVTGRVSPCRLSCMFYNINRIIMEIYRD